MNHAGTDPGRPLWLSWKTQGCRVLREDGRPTQDYLMWTPLGTHQADGRFRNFTLPLNVEDSSRCWGLPISTYVAYWGFARSRLIAMKGSTLQQLKRWAELPRRQVHSPLVAFTSDPHFYLVSGACRCLEVEVKVIISCYWLRGSVMAAV